MARLNGKSAIIVGGTSGIGKATVELFAKEGARIIFTGRRQEKGDKIVKELNLGQDMVEFIQADSLKSDDLNRVVDRAIEKFGKIDILHNNAGILIEDPIEEIDLVKNFDVTMDLNVRSYLEMIQIVLPYMKKERSGSIINTASVGGVTSMPNYLTYATSKAAVIHMTRSMAREVGEYGVRVNALCPGLTISEMVEEGSEFEKNVLPGVALNRAAKPEEMAYGALFLGSDESSYVTGLSLLMDGGLSV